MIYLQNLKKQFGPKVLFDDISFHLRPKERVGLVGENGTGKTTLLRAIINRVGLDSGKIVLRKGARAALLEQELERAGGTVLERVVHGDSHFSEVTREMERLEKDSEYHQRAPEEWSRRYGHLQHEFERLGGYQRESRAQTILLGLAFKPDQLDQPLEQFSGGWRMRVELARLLLQNPEVLLLDEPTNHLDLQTVIWLESFLNNYDGSILLISHDRRFLNALVSRIVELDRGQLTVYTGNYDTYEQLKEDRIAQLEAQAASQSRRVGQVERFIERFRAKNTKATQVKSKIKMLEKMGKIETFQQTKAIRFRFPQPKRTGRLVAEFKNVCKRYGDVTVYRDFSILLERGFKVALVGENGAGKSTFLKLLAGVIDYQEGEIKLGTNVTRAYFAQHLIEILDGSHTVLESLEQDAGHLLRTVKQNILGAFLFSGDDVLKKVSVLSGGERSRLSLARILASPASLLLLDEPTNHLDMRSCEMLAAALADYEGTLVTISHDRYFLDGIINRVWEVNAGTVKEYVGSYSDYRWAKSREAETEAGALAESAEPEKSSASKKDKERKRQEAEARNQRYRRLKPLQDRLKEVEQKLESVIQEKQTVETQLADSSLYEDNRKSDRVATLDRQTALAQEESTLMAEWDQLSEQIEDIQNTPTPEL
ncbi:MAG: ABC-F family ATP-binding cassette domain-containing protein [Nitrospinae bacterium]|nr:ABC-F family ATP-binding cassette domain-containing protein [Nitrospinota bacterium]